MSIITDRAVDYLTHHDFRVLDKNWERNALGDLPIVAVEQSTIVAVEVFPRTVRHPFLSRARVNRLRMLTVAWMDAHGVRYDRMRVDVVMVTDQGVGGFITEHVRDVGAGI